MRCPLPPFGPQTCALARPTRVSTLAATLVQDVCDLGGNVTLQGGGGGLSDRRITGSLPPPGPGASASATAAFLSHLMVVTTSQLLDNKGVVRMGGGGATYHGEVPGLGEVWVRACGPRCISVLSGRSVGAYMWT